MNELLFGTALLAPLACVISAAVLAWNKTDGWGWFLFVAVMIAPSSARLALGAA